MNWLDTLRARLELNHLVFAVWIPQRGWLREANDKEVFVTTHIAVAESAARLRGHGARVEAFSDDPKDASMLALEQIFLKMK